MVKKKKKKKSCPLPCKHCILHLQSVVMKHLTLRKAAHYHGKGTFKCSTPYPPSIQGLYQTNSKESIRSYCAKRQTLKRKLCRHICCFLQNSTALKKRKGLRMCRHVALRYQSDEDIKPRKARLILFYIMLCSMKAYQLPKNNGFYNS